MATVIMIGAYHTQTPIWYPSPLVAHVSLTYTSHLSVVLAHTHTHTPTALCAPTVATLSVCVDTAHALRHAN